MIELIVRFTQGYNTWNTFCLLLNMKLKLSYILLLLTILPCSGLASELLKVGRIDTKDIVQIYFSFDETPQFTSTQYDRRIDLEFFATTQVPALSLGEPDSDIVKILPRPGKDRYILSLFFRYRHAGHAAPAY